MKSLALITNFFPPQVGGIEEYLWQFVQHYPGDVLLVSPQEVKKPLPKNTTHLEMRFFAPRPMFPAWMPFLTHLQRELKQREVQGILLGHFAPYAPGIAVLARTLRVPWATMLHGVDFFQWNDSAFRSWLRGKTFRSANAIIANSAYLAEEARRAGATTTQLRIASPGINPQDFYSDRPKRFFADQNLLGKRVLLSVGRLILRKGFDTTIAAFARIHREMPESVLVILGEGPERERLVREVQRRGLTDAVRFLGEVADLVERRRWYSAADCFVMPTRVVGNWDTESFGIVYLEALACGTPIVASELGGVQEILQHGKNGFFAGDGTDPALVARRVLDILQHPEVQRTMVAHARESVIPAYTWDNQFSKLFPLWSSY